MKDKPLFLLTLKGIALLGLLLLSLFKLFVVIPKRVKMHREIEFTHTNWQPAFSAFDQTHKADVGSSNWNYWFERASIETTNANSRWHDRAAREDK